MDIFDAPGEMLLITNVSIPVITLPERTSAQDLLGGEGLPRLYDGGEGESRTLLDQDMNMIGHDHPRQKVIPDAVEMTERIADDLSMRRLAKGTGSHAIIKYPIDAAMPFCCLSHSIVGVHGLGFVGQSLDNNARQGIRQAEGDCLGHAFVIEVR